jgi:outer membrane receptor protein involved in Fe transport
MLKYQSRSLLLAALLAAWIPAFAQTSQLNGRVLDPSQSAVGAAQVTLAKSGGGETRRTVSATDGVFLFPLLQPGIYTLTVEKDGFRTHSIKDIVVETGQISRLTVQLELGALSQSVAIEADAPLLQSESAAVSRVVTNESISRLPLVDRRAVQLIRLNGFVVQKNSGSSVSFAVGGGRGSSSNYFLDGGTVQNVALGDQGIYFDPPVEAMREFNVNTSTYSAELGRTGAAVVEITTKSGTNDFHGTLFEYFRNDALNANTYFATLKPVLRYNLFGANLGGPVVRDRLWFFLNYEGRRQKSGDTKSLTLPTAAEAGGNFSASARTVYDPLSGLPFANNIIPVTRQDKVGAKLASYYPKPDNSNSGVNYTRNSPGRTTADNYVARVDYLLGANDRISGRFLGQPDEIAYGSVFPVAGTDPFGYLTHEYYYNWGGNWMHTISRTSYNDFRANMSRRQRLSISSSADTTLGAQVGLAGVPRSYFPSVTVSGYAVLGDGSGAPNGNGQYRSQTPVYSHLIGDTVTLIRGKHQIRIGAEYRYGRSVDVAGSTAGGALTFNNQVTGSSIASLLLGWVNSGSVSLSEQLDSRLDTYAAFVQDDWRLSPKLTLNVGLRYDADSPRRDRNNRQNGFDPYAINPISGTPGVITFAGANEYSSNANDWDLNNFGPRLGLAWKATENWVVRAGGAVLYNASYGLGTTTVLYTGFNTQGAFTSSNNGKTPAFLLADGFPALSYPSADNRNSSYGAVKVGNSPTTDFQFMQKDRRTPYVYQSSLNVQRRIVGNLMAELAYLGTFGQHLTGSASTAAPNINQVPTQLLRAGNLQSLRPFPQFGNITMIGGDFGRSSYHGLNAGIQRRYSRGLQFSANYTWSKLIDNIPSQDLGTTVAITDYYNRRNNKGLGGNDIRHRIISSATYDLPFGSSQRVRTSSHWLDSIIGGWSLNGIGEFYTGSPLSVSELTNSTNSYSTAVRPNVVGDPNLSGDRTRSEKLARWFNTSAFAAPAAYTFGNAGRSFGSGPSFFSVDGSLLKQYSWHERWKSEFRMEVMNLTNHANFANPNTQRGSSTFGKVTSLVTGNQARIIQLGLRLQF